MAITSKMLGHHTDVINMPSHSQRKDYKRHEDDGGGKLVEATNPSTGNDVFGTEKIIITTCSIMACCIIIVTCALCFRSRNKALRQKSVLGRLMIGMDSRSPFGITSIPNQTNYSEDVDDIESAKSRDFDKFEMVTCQMTENQPESPQYLQMEDPSTTSTSLKDYNANRPFPSTSLEELHDRKKFRKTESLTELLPDEPTGAAHALRRTISMSNFGRANVEQATNPVIKTTFTVHYDEWDFSLTLILHNISNVPQKAWSCDIFATISLIPTSTERRHTKILSCENDFVSFEEEHFFRNIRKLPLENSTIRISIYSRKRGRYEKKESLLGEVFLQCSDVDWQWNAPTRFTKHAPRKRLTKMSTSDKLLGRNLGELFVDLQYQSMANRLKVFVRKAIQLSPTDRMMVVKPAHYVIVKLIQNNTVVEVKRTRSQSGPNAVWNQAFLFNIENNIETYSLEFLIMKGKLHKKDNVVGKVEIGPDSSRRGREHWKSILRPGRVDVAKWHSILPVFAY